MLYSEEGGWYFIHVPKNAGTAITANFSPPGALVNDGDTLPDQKRIANRHNYKIKRLPINGHTIHNKANFWQWSEETNGLQPIAILRHPWSRALSMYLFNLKITQENLHTEWGSIDHPRLVREGFKKSWMPGGFFVDGHAKSIEYSEETGRAWSQDDDQFSWLEGVEECRWFRLEDQMDDFYQFTGLPRARYVNTTKKADFRKYYDDELINRIGTIFKRDVDLGGYTFE